MKYSLLPVCAIIMGFACSHNNKDAIPEPSLPTAVTLQAKVLTDGLQYPWELVWGPDDFIWLTERGGRISRVHPATGAVQPLLQVPDVRSNGEGGLLGMTLHPNFSSNPYVYAVYNYNSGNGYKEKVVRFTYSNGTLADPQTLIQNIDAAGIHNGSRLLIWNDKLYITTGDAAQRSTAQNKGTLNGKVLRLQLDGRIPADNPLPDSPVWSWGHRNAQGLIRVGNTIFSSEHGQGTDDEINIIEKGRNYGWPDVEGLCDEGGEGNFCTTHNIKEPVKTWTPTAAVSGIDYYDAAAIPQWKNSILVTALKNARLYQLQLNEARTAVVATKEFFNNDYGRLRDVCTAPDGKVYFCTSNGNNDKIVVVSP